MPSKCPFCRRKYSRSGAYEKHLRTAHPGLDIVLASTVQYTPAENHIGNMDISVWRNSDAREPQDSDYESDPSTAGFPPIASYGDMAHESDTEPLHHATSPIVGNQIHYGRAGEVIGDVKGFDHENSNLCEDPWAPFSSAQGFKLASWFIDGKVSKTRINEYFSSGLGNSETVGYSSMHTLDQHLRLLDPYSHYLQWFEGQVEDGQRTLPFFYRNVLQCVRYLLRQIAYRDDLVYAPRREYDPTGQRIYAEMHTADWWWDVQETLPPGATVIPIIGMSDQTHLTNFSGDKKAWPVYITIGNLPSALRNRPGSMAVLLLALLPVPPKFSNSSKADHRQRQINADTLHDVFSLIFAPLQDVAHPGVPIDCADGKVRQCFPILSAWIADHMENVALHGLKSNACPKCEVPSHELGNNDHSYRARDYARDELYGPETQIPGFKSHSSRTTDNTLGMGLGKNIFHSLDRVSASDVHKPDILHTVYLGIFKHMMDWIQGFLKKHGRLQAFDDVWKALPPYPGFLVPKKAYREVTQWQGKEMRNLGRCILGVLAVALRQPEAPQAIPFKRALRCVRALVDFNMMAQYRSHTPDTISYMEDYLDQFHQMKDIFLEFRVTKRTLTKVDEQRKALRRQRGQLSNQVSALRRRQICHDERDEENELRMDLIQGESHFNFIKMHLLSHFCDHIRQFGNIPMYSTEIGELAHKTQIKEGWRQSNKNDAARQILHNYGRHHAIRMRLLNLESLQKRGAELSADVLQHLDRTTSTISRPVVHRRCLKGRRDDVSTVVDLSSISGVTLELIYRELIRYSRHNLPFDHRLPEEHARLGSLPVELLTQLEIPVLAFQEAEVYEIHRARCTGALHFRNQGSRNDWVWVQAGTEEMYGALRGRLPAKLVALFKIRDYRRYDSVRRLAGVQMLTPVNSGRLSDIHGLVTVQMREEARGFRIVDIGTILGLAHLIPEEERRWLVNSRIDLRTFNEIY